MLARLGLEALFQPLVPGIAAVRIHEVEQMHWTDALKVGLVQCAALVPGTSRSGATIIGAMMFGFSRMRVKRQILDQLSDAHDFEVPEGMVNLEFDAIWHQVEHDREQGRVDPDDAGKDDEDVKAEYRAIAERRRWSGASRTTSP